MYISYETERALAKKLLVAAGMVEDEADILGEVIAHSDFTGVYSHGLSRLTTYLNSLKSGKLKARPEMKILTDTGAAVLYDCDGGSGIVALTKVYEDVCTRAKQYGIAIGSGRNSANIGCGHYYGVRAAKDGVMCIICSNTYRCMAPHGGADLLIGTNPIIAAVPTADTHPMVMDISTSGVAVGKIHAAKREGKPIPEGWANDIDGKPTTDPNDAYAVLPIAGHKGYALAVMVDAFGALLSGSQHGTGPGLPTEPNPENTGFCVIVIDPSKFMPIDEFKRNADEYVHMMKNSRLAQGFDEIYMPGEPEFKKFEKFYETGIEVSAALGEELCTIAAGLGIISENENFNDLISIL